MLYTHTYTTPYNKREYRTRYVYINSTCLDENKFIRAGALLAGETLIWPVVHVHFGMKRKRKRIRKIYATTTSKALEVFFNEACSLATAS